MVDDKDFQMLWSTAFECEDKDRYITDNEAILGKAFRTQDKRQEYLGKIWDVAHLSIRELIDKTGYNQTSFARHFCIPHRTVQNWCNSVNTCPPWVKLGLARQLGML